jgi:hypothetical protein
MCYRLQRNAEPSTQMRCMITAKRRAGATIAFFIARRLAICIAQTLSTIVSNAPDQSCFRRSRTTTSTRAIS